MPSYSSLAFIALSCTAAASAHLHGHNHYTNEFASWQAKHHKFFANKDEYRQRLDIFKNNSDFVETHNQGNHTWTAGLNQFSHLSPAEFKALVSTNIPRRSTSIPRKLLAANAVTSTASSIDWVTAGAVTSVKNQGSCGSCWSFSTAGALEGAYYNQYGTLQSFSMQQLVDCDTSDSGCSGGLMDNAFGWIESNGGLCSYSDYPYTTATYDGTAGTCETTCTPVTGSTISSYTDVTSNSASALETALNIQPVSVAIEADQTAFQYYSSGVLTGTCGTSLDHGVLAVGYGYDSTTGYNYWKVKNSWGTSWGEDGYIRINKDSTQTDGLCGILAEPSYPNL